MLHTITKRLEICIDINTEISKVDHYAQVFFPANGSQVTLTKYKT